MASQVSFQSLYHCAAYTSHLPKFSTKQQQKHTPSTNSLLRKHYISSSSSSSHSFSLSRSSSKYVSSIGSSGKDEFIFEDEPALRMTHTNETEYNRVNCLVYLLHESARSFSLAIQNLFSRSVPELSNAWNGVDVNAWHKRTAYQVAVYALLKAAIEVELFLCHKRCNTPVYKILSPKALYLGEFVENQLHAKKPELVQWFRMVELPRIAGLFIPLFKKWSVEYAGSGIAGIILAISCCSAVTKLGSGRFSCPEVAAAINIALVQLRDLACDLAVDKLHQLSIEAGFEDDFLSYCGKKVIPSKNIEDVEFWIGLVQEKLSVAFHRESVITPNQTSFDKVEETTLATLGLFAYLGRETRLYLSGMNIKDMDDQIKNFLGYLECGSLYIYPEFNSLPRYQLFTEVVIDEIGWLDFYAPLKSKFQYGGRRSRKRARQAEKEIILYTVLTVCYDVFSGFAHYSSSSKQPLDSDILSFLLQSQNLLSICLEEYWAAYDKSGELMKFTESILLEAQLKPIELTKRGRHKDISLAGINNVKLTEKEHGTKTKRLHERLWRNSTEKFISARNVILMGTHLLFIDVSELIRLLVKQLRGKKITSRERRKIKRTLNDIVTLVPVTILMLIPVTAVGHAAILAAINKYVPSMIPSPYSSERLNLVRQLKRTKKMEVESRVVEDASQIREKY